MKKKTISRGGFVIPVVTGMILASVMEKMVLLIDEQRTTTNPFISRFIGLSLQHHWVNGMFSMESNNNNQRPPRQQQQNYQERQLLQVKLEECALQLEQQNNNLLHHSNHHHHHPKEEEEAEIITNNTRSLSTTASTTSTITTTTSTTTVAPVVVVVASICAIQKDGLYYLDEWIDYHLALGFQTIYIYDNSDHFELQNWNRYHGRNPNQVIVKHFPGSKQQRAAYNDCVWQEKQKIQRIQQQQQQSIEQKSWLAFLDIDEFIVLKQHNSIIEMLEYTMVFAYDKLNHHHHAGNAFLTDKNNNNENGDKKQQQQQQPQGFNNKNNDDNQYHHPTILNPVALSLNRFSFYFISTEEEGKNQTNSNNNTSSSSLSLSLSYEPLPVTQRFQYRVKTADRFVKTMAMTQSIMKPDVHGHKYWNGIAPYGPSISATAAAAAAAAFRRDVPVDTNGRIVDSIPSPHEPATDIAVIHHYQTKSLEEFRSKCQRGDAVHGKLTISSTTTDSSSTSSSSTENTTTTTTEDTLVTTKARVKGNQEACLPKDYIIEKFRNITIDCGGTVFDDSAWKFLYKAVPMYSRYNRVAS